MNHQNKPTLSVEGAQGLLALLAEIDLVKTADDYRDFINDVCTVREKLSEDITVQLRAIAGLNESGKAVPAEGPDYSIVFSRVDELVANGDGRTGAEGEKRLVDAESAEFAKTFLNSCIEAGLSEPEVKMNSSDGIDVFWKTEGVIVQAGMFVDIPRMGQSYMFKIDGTRDGWYSSGEEGHLINEKMIQAVREYFPRTN
jgi:hypothetical protein